MLKNHPKLTRSTQTNKNPAELSLFAQDSLEGEKLEVENTMENDFTVEKRIEMAHEFFCRLYKGCSGYSYLWLKKDDNTLTLPFSVSDTAALKSMAQKAIEYNDNGANVFVGVNLTDSPVQSPKRAKKADITFQTAIIADIDIENGLWHKSDNNKKYPATFEQAKNFLPFTPTILIDSGAGLHAYNLFNSPVRLDDDLARKQAENIGADYIQMIREKAGEYKSAVDSVQDLPRILRLPGTYNLKHGKENAPLCKLIAQGGTFSADELSKLIRHVSTNSIQKIVDTDYNKNRPTEQERALAMLKSFSPVSLTYDEWREVGMALKNNGNSCADWIDWSKQDERFKVGECESKWNGFNRTGLNIATIHYLAKTYGNYSESVALREWHIDNKIADMVKSHCKNKSNDFTNSDTSILSARVGLVNERTDFSMGTDTTVTNSTVNSDAALTPRKVKKSNIKYYTAREVAKMLGVDEKTIRRWRQKNIFGEDVLDHNGVYWYAAERVEQLKSVYHKGWEKIYKDNDKNSLETELLIINEELAAFDNEKTSAIALLNKSDMKFDKETMFADDYINAGAFAYLFDSKTLAHIKDGIKNQNKENFLRDWQNSVKDKADDLKNTLDSLNAEKLSIEGKISNVKFLSKNEWLKDLVIPENYIISDDRGIEKIVKGKKFQVCLRPVSIKSVQLDYDSKTYKITLSFKSATGKWCDIPPNDFSVIADSRKLIATADFGFPVTSQNSKFIVEYLDALYHANENKFPLSYSVARCGWQTIQGVDYFIDPRRLPLILVGDKKIPITVADSNFSRNLKIEGSADEWFKAYDLIQNSPIAKFQIHAALAAPLLKPLHERSFGLHTFGKTRAGKSTITELGATVYGDTQIVVSFDSTINGLTAYAAECNYFPVFIDEKQAADKKMQNEISRIHYTLLNERGRLRANINGKYKPRDQYHLILTTNGETELFADNTTGGAFTRTIQLPLRKEILPPDVCREIREIYKFNYGHAFPLFHDYFTRLNFDELREKYKSLCDRFIKRYRYVLPDHCRYIALITLTDQLFNEMLDKGTEEDRLKTSMDTAKAIFSIVPTMSDISDAQREFDFVQNFITQNQRKFIKGSDGDDFLNEVYGKFEPEQRANEKPHYDTCYLIKSVFDKVCYDAGFDSKKVVDDLISENIIIPKVPNSRKAHDIYQQKKIGSINAWCIKIKLADDFNE